MRLEFATRDAERHADQAALAKVRSMSTCERCRRAPAVSVRSLEGAFRALCERCGGSVSAATRGRRERSSSLGTEAWRARLEIEHLELDGLE